MSSKKRVSIKDSLRKQRDKTYKSKDEGGLSFTNYLNLREYNLERFSDEDDSDYLIDILPYEISTDSHPNRKKGEMAYHLDVWVHKGIGPDKGNYLCMKKTHGERCVMCEEFLRLQAEGWDYEDIKHLYPKRRIIYHIKKDDKRYVYDTSFKLFEELWLKAVMKKEEKGKVIDVFYQNDEDCYSLEFTTTDKRGIGRYIQFDFVEIEDFNEKFLDDLISLEKLLVIPDQAKIEEILKKGEIETEEEDKPIVEENHDDYYKEVIEKEEIKEPEEKETKEPKRKPKRKEKRKEKLSFECPNEFTFGVDFDEFHECDDCKEEHSDIYNACEKKYQEEN